MSVPVCLVTGAASGIGAATALRFAREGWAVAINNFDHGTRAAAEAVAAQCGDAGAPTLIVDADVGDDAACRASGSTRVFSNSRWLRLSATKRCVKASSSTAAEPASSPSNCGTQLGATKLKSSESKTSKPQPSQAAKITAH